MANVTLIGEKLAKKDYVFIYRGPLSECRDCKVKTVCFNLEEGRKYKIIEIRSMHHNCKTHEGGVRAVEFEKLPIVIAIDVKLAEKGAKLEFDESDECNDMGCKFYRICVPPGIKPGEKYEVVAIGNTIQCTKGKNLKEVTLKDLI